MSVDHVNHTVGQPSQAHPGGPSVLTASLGTVGYAAFALLQPIPLSEIVPFPEVVAAFEAEAEAASLAAVPLTPEPVAPEPVAPEPVAPEQEFTNNVLALVETPEPVVYTEGGYRPQTYTEGGYHPVPLEPTLAASDGTPAVVDQPSRTAFAVAAADADAAATDDTVLREVAELETMNTTRPVGTVAPVAPDEVVETHAHPKSFTVGGYAADGASDDSRARQVLDELSFLFNEG